MKIAYKHLVNNIKTQPRIEEISDKLFQLGHEHDIQNEIFDIEFTPNRGDCLSVNGLLRDLNVFYDIRFDNKEFENEIESFDMKFINNAEADCNNITFLKIEIDGKIKEYKSQLKEYFQLLDVNKKNFFTDVSNYVSYETGQPTHCYDSSKLGDTICLERLNSQCKFKTLLDKEILLTDDDLVFKSKNEVINLAGIVGGQNSSCSSKTNSVIIECAFFNPEIIIGKSLKYGIQSDAAYKFERGVDPNCQEKVLRRFIKIVMDHAEVTSVKIFNKSFNEKPHNTIPYNLASINKIIGMPISKEQYESNLKNLGFKIKENMIEVPTYRSDIRTQNDLAEELARCIGYNNIASSPLNIKNVNFKNSPEIVKENITKNLLIDNGFHEVINFPFTDNSSSSIKLDNPIDVNKPYFRENINHSLLDNLLYNERRQQDSIKLFEFSDIYKLNKNGEYENYRKLSIIASGRVGRNYKEFSKKIDQPYLGSIIGKYLQNPSSDIKELSRDKLNTKLKTKIFYLEIYLSELSDQILKYEPKSGFSSEFAIYEPISEFPKIVRDLSFSLKDHKRFEDLNSLVENFKNDYLKESFIFDLYNDQSNQILKIGYRFTFQSNKKTLTDNDVNKIMSTLISESLSIPGIEIPGI